MITFTLTAKTVREYKDETIIKNSLLQIKNHDKEARPTAFEAEANLRNTVYNILYLPIYKNN